MKEKRLDFELLRLIAIFGVVFNHTQLRGWELYTISARGSFNYTMSLLMGIVCKVAVPLFFLVSGGLLLHKEEPIRTVLKKRVLRVLTALLLFSGMTYAIWAFWGMEDTPGLVDLLRQVWSTGISNPYWYLYTYLGLMLMLPLLRPMVRNMSDRAFVYLAGLHVALYGVFYTAGILLEWGPVDSDLLMPMVEPELFYFIMGYYLHHRFSWEGFGRKQLGLAWLCAVLAVVVMLFLADRNTARYGYTYMSYHKSLMVFPVFAVYGTVRQLCAAHPIPAGPGRVIAALGGCVFGCYLLEGILRHGLEGIYLALEPRIHVLPACLVWVTAVVLSGLAITWVLKKLPLLRKIL